MAKELHQDGQDAALAALAGAAISAKTNWLVPLTGDPGADRAATVNSIFSLRFQGADAISMPASAWGAPSGTSPDPRTRKNGSTVATAAASGLGAPIDVGYYAIVRTSDNLVPDGTWSNVDEVIGRGAMDAVKTGVDNGDVIQFAANTVTLEID